MRFRRHTAAKEPRRASSSRTRMRTGRLLRDVAILVGVFIVGYGISVLWLSPAPLGTSEHALPNLLERPTADARSELERLGYRVRLDDARPHHTIARGSIVWQDPAAGTVMAEGQTVTLVPSAGPAGVFLPDLTGLGVTDAQTILEAAGLRVADVDSVARSDDPGVVLATRPAAGTARPRGSGVTLVVSVPAARRSVGGPISGRGARTDRYGGSVRRWWP